MMAKKTGTKPADPPSVPAEGEPSEKQVLEGQESADDSSKEARSEADEKLKSMESELGRLKQELGDSRKKSEELNAYKLWYDQNAAKVQQQQVPQQTKPNYDDQWFDKPTETFDKMAQERDRKLIYQQAYQQAPMAKAMAKTQHPEAFEGIEDAELEQAMYGGVQSGTINPGAMADPNAWLGAAWILRGPKLGYKIPGAAPQGMVPPPTEKPGGKPPEEDEQIPDIQGDALTDSLIAEAKKLGITKEEFLKEVQATKEGRI